MTNSRRVQRFITDVATDPEGALKRLREDLHAARGPLVEEIPGSDRVLVTFVHIAAAKSVGLSCQLTALPPPAMATPMQRVPDTDVWHLSAEADPRVCASYQFFLDPPEPLGSMAEMLAIAADEKAMTAFMGSMFAAARPDEFNPELLFQPAPGGPGSESLLTLPQAEPFPYLDGSPLRGRLEEHVLSTSALPGDRNVTVYLPPDYDPAISYPLVVVLDGEMAVQISRIPEVLDGAIARQAVPPVIAVFVHNLTAASRMVEMACNPALTTMLADEVLPWARKHYSVSEDPAKIVLAGMSYGGLGTAWTVLNRADAFGSALIMSGSFWFAPPGEAPQWLTREYLSRERQPVRLLITVGTLENVPIGMPGLEDVSMVDVARGFRDAVVERGYEVVDYVEVPAAHDLVNPRRVVVPGLAKLLG